MSPTSLESCEAFSRSAEIYDLIHAGKDYDGEAARVLELLGPVLPAGEGRTLVDWGCGTGEFTRRFQDAGWDAGGVEKSEPMLQIAQKKGVGIYLGADMETGLRNGGTCHAQTCLFAAFSYASAAHPPLLILENFRRVAAPGGKLVFDFVNADAEIRWQQQRRAGKYSVIQEKRLVDMRLIENAVTYATSSEVWQELHYLRTYLPREIAELIARAGWKLEKFVDLEDALATKRGIFGQPYYLTAVCSAA